MEGQLIRSLDDLQDGGCYVVSGGEAFKKVPYLLDDENELSTLRAKELRQKEKNKHKNSMQLGMLNADSIVFETKEKPFFTPVILTFLFLVYSIQNFSFCKW